MSILVLGSIHVDLVVRGERLPRPGETVLGGVFSRGFGGKGANQAVAASRLGRLATSHSTNRPRVAMIGAVGDDAFGVDCRNTLASAGIDVTLVKTVPQTATGLALIAVDKQGRNQISVASGASACLTEADILAIAADYFSAGGIFLACQEVPLAAVWAGLRRARDAGMITLFNPAPAIGPLPREMATAIDWIIPNEHEAAVTAGLLDISANTPGAKQEAARQAGDRLIELGCRHAITTLGEHGGIVCGEMAHAYTAFAVDVVDTTAAGDTFCGALAVALQDRRDPHDAIRFAAAAAALTVTKSGAQSSIPQRRDCLELAALTD